MDGGLSLAVASLGPREVFLISTRDVHPSLYYLMLHYWMLLVGKTPLAAKYLSVIFSVLTVALLYAIGRRLRHPRLGLVATFLIAVSSMHVANAQEVRDFTAAGFFAALSTYSFLNLLRNQQGNPGRTTRAEWLGFVLGSVGGLLTSYLNVGVLAAHALYALTTARSWQTLRRWSVAFGATAVLYAPWGWVALTSTLEKLSRQQRPRPPGQGVGALGTFVADALHQLSANEFVTFDWRPVGAIYLLALLAGVLWGAVARRRASADSGSPPIAHGGFLVLALVMVLAVTYLTVRFWLGLGLPSRYAVIAAPFFLLLVACGLEGLADSNRLVPAVALAVLAASGTLSLHQYYTHPPLPPSFWNPQGVVKYLDTKAKDGDGIVFITLEQAGYYDSLTERHLHWDYFIVGPSYLEADLAQRVQQVLPALAAKHEVLWLVFYQNGIAPSSRHIASWLNRNTYAAGQERLSDTTVLRYVSPRVQPSPVPVGANFGNLILLQDAGFTSQVSAGGDIKLWVNCKTIGVINEDYTVFVHFVDDNGNLRAQRDSPPQNGEAPTSRWRVDETLVDRRAIGLPADLPPGNYWLEMGFYRGEKRIDLVHGGNSLRLGPIVVE